MGKEISFTEAAGVVGSAGTGGWWFYQKIYKPYSERRKKDKNAISVMFQEIRDRIESVSSDMLERFDALEDNQKLILNIQRRAFFFSGKYGACVYASPELCKVMGHSESEILGYNWVNCIIQDQREYVREAWDNSIEDRTAFDMKYTFKRSDANLQDVLCICFHRYDKKGYVSSVGSIEPVGNPYQK